MLTVYCPSCLRSFSPSDSCRRAAHLRPAIVAHGSFLRRSDQKRVLRFWCRPCQRSFSQATLSPCYRQKKRHLNPLIFQHLVSGHSQRRLARVLRANRKTITRKFLFLGLHSYDYFLKHRQTHPPSLEIQFDDLESFEHSKLKPLSVMTVVEAGSRRILGFRVARMPAKGLLVQKSLKKYGPRVDERRRCRQALLQELQPFVEPEGVIKSDENPHYPKDLRRYFPRASHRVYPGRRGCVVGQGELKSGGFDPLFSLNHTYAMFRANINRLFRRTWNTTKKPERLALHIALYVLYHNLYLIHNPAR